MAGVAVRRVGNRHANRPGAAARRRWTSERGAAAVEFALVLPILLLLVFGIVEFGRTFQVQATLSAAAREGVRVMAVQNNQAAAKAAVRSATTSLSPVPTDLQITVTPTSCSTVGGNATVTIHYRLNSLTGFFGWGYDLTGKGVMRCSG
jgi:Flp pilus assembly protein TadG